VSFVTDPPFAKGLLSQDFRNRQFANLVNRPRRHSVVAT